jgi:class 3 adenylate cyclase
VAAASAAREPAGLTAGCPDRRRGDPIAGRAMARSRMADDLAPCAECRAPLPANARFCPQCGARVASAAPPAGERRPVAILFVDLAGFTRLTSQADAEDVHALLGRFFDVVDGVIARAGGTIDKHIGDATMGVFGAPVAYGNDIERAVRAACDVHEAMVALSAEFGRPLATHVGVASGEVVAASVGSTQRADYTVTGDAVNLASRLEELAGAGETIVSDDVRRALGARLVAESRGTLAVRGFANEMAVWRVVSLDSRATERHRLVGRARERARFGSLVAALAEGGPGATLLIRGDAGVGKTHLTEALLDDARRHGCACHAANVLDFGAAQGREATNLIARSLLALDSTSGAAECRRALDRALGSGLARREDAPFLADLLALEQAPGSRYDAMDHATRARGRIEALAVLVVASARAQALVVLVEDVHWASAPTQDALAALRDCATHHRVLLVLTTRRDGDFVSDRWQPGGVETLSLEPLSSDESLELAKAYLGAHPEVARRCVERAQGNPLFLTQLLQSGADRGTVPGGIASVVLARLDRLPAQEKAALQAASVAGQRFDPALVAHLAEPGGAALAEARARDLVRDGAAGELAFSHALIRDAVYGSLLHSARRALHRRAADWYRERDRVLRAEHLERAEDDAAPQAFLDAALEAASALHQDVALSLAQRGASLARPGALAHALQMLAGELARDLGDAASSASAFERAAELAPDDAARCRASIGIASAHRLTSASAPAFAALDVAEAIAARLALANERARIAYLRGCLHFARGELHEAAAQHERAREGARASGDETVEAQALSGLADLLYANGRLASAHEAFARCVALCERRGERRFALMNRNMMGLVGVYLGATPRSLAALAQARDEAREIGHRVAEVMADECAGMVLVASGRDAEAVEPLERSLALARAIASRRFAAIDLAMLGIVAARAGRREDAQARFDESWSILREIGASFAGPIVLGARSRIAPSDSERHSLLAQGEALLGQGSLSHNHFWFREAAIEASLDAGDADEAERHAAALERYAAAEPTPWSELVVARARALVAALRGNADAAGLESLAKRAAAMDLRAAVPALRRAACSAA